jgi:hypothetical protein
MLSELIVAAVADVRAGRQTSPFWRRPASSFQPPVRPFATFVAESPGPTDGFPPGTLAALVAALQQEHGIFRSGYNPRAEAERLLAKL